MQKYLLRFILTAILSFAYLAVSFTTSFAADPLAQWNTATSLPHALASHASLIANGSVYVFGGATVDDYKSVYSASVSSGSVSNWGLVNNLPETRYRLSVVNFGDYVYVLGGMSYDGSQNYHSTVHKSKIQEDGSLSSWQAVTSLPRERAMGKAVVVGDKIYYVGGLDGTGSIRSEIFAANINSDGTLGSWSTVGYLPMGIRSFGLVEYNNHLIVTGGDISSSPLISNKAYMANINPDGTVSAFQDQGSMPQQTSSPQVIRVGDILLSVGGGNFGGLIDETYYTKINSNGTLGVWQTSSKILPEGIAAGAISYANGYLYLTGGVGGTGGSSGYRDKVYSAKFNPDTGLNVPLLKQTDPAWKDNIYDTANIWSPGDPTISRWGCALTSAAMVFKYFGINKLPGSVNLDPGTLNTWLKGQVDGYVGGGLINWMALSRLSKIAKPLNSSFTAGDALEYSRFGSNKSQLTADLNNNIPGILEEPGHFIVATGIDGSTYKINDPFYNRLDLTAYSNSFISLSRFVPSKTDLSYLMFLVDPTVNIQLKTSSGSAVGESFIQQPLDSDGGSGTSGPPVRMLILPKPASGEYSLDVSSTSNKSYQIEVYLYDNAGEVKIESISGVIGEDNEDKFVIKFDKNVLGNSIISQSVTFQQLIADIELLYAQMQINIQAYAPSIVHANVAWDLSSKIQTKKVAIDRLRIIDSFLIRWRDKGVTTAAYNILHSDILALISTLN